MLAFVVNIWHRILPVFPSIHQLLIWNELEPFYIVKKVKEEISESSFLTSSSSEHTTSTIPIIFAPQTNSYQIYSSDNLSPILKTMLM